MSLDVWLEGYGPSPDGTGIFVRENGTIKEITRAEWDARFPGREPLIAKTPDIAGDPEANWHSLFDANITHNLNHMADEAGIYKALWRPEEIGIEIAAQLIDPLRAGLSLLKSDPERFRKLNPSNGWGTYEGLVRFVQKYLEACEAYPTAKVRVSR